MVHFNGGPENPTGFYENGTIIDRVNKELLWNLGYDPRGQQRLPDHTIERFEISNIIYEIIQAQGVPENEPWYFKDPKTLLLYGSYLKSFPGAKWVLVRRDIDDNIDSCIRASFLMARESVADWLEYVKHYLGLAEHLQNECENVKVVWYDKIIEGNLDELAETIYWLGLDFNSDYIEQIVIRK
jgi:hypothetical protein